MLTLIERETKNVCHSLTAMNFVSVKLQNLWSVAAAIMHDWDRVYVFSLRLTLDWANYPDQGAAPADADKKREGA